MEKIKWKNKRRNAFFVLRYIQSIQYNKRRKWKTPTQLSFTWYVLKNQQAFSDLIQLIHVGTKHTADLVKTLFKSRGFTRSKFHRIFETAQETLASSN